MDEMTSRIVTKRRVYYVYDVRDSHEALGLAHIIEARLDKSGGKLKNNRIDAWKVMDSDFTYYAKIRNNSDIEIRKVGN